MKARFPGECRRCGGPIRVGDEIDSSSGSIIRSYWHAECPEDGPVFVVSRVVGRMHRMHNVGLGCWGVPPGVRPTFSRRQFYGLAEEAGVMSEDEARILREYWATVWDRDLSV